MILLGRVGKTVFITLSLLVAWCVSLIHHLSIHHDDRKVFKIETFGFNKGGRMDIKVTNFALHLTEVEKKTYTHKSDGNSSIVVPAWKAKTPPKQNNNNNSTSWNKNGGNANAKPAPQNGGNANAKPAPKSWNSTSSVGSTKPKPQPQYNSSSNANKAPWAAKNASSAGAHSRRLELSGSKTGSSSSGKSSSSGAAKTKMHYVVGFVMRKASSESEAQADLEAIIEKDQCILEQLKPDDVFLDLSQTRNWGRQHLIHEIGDDGVGLYSLIFARCQPVGKHYIDFTLDATFYNPGPNYLSAGDTLLPKLYLTFFLLFTASLIGWVWVLTRDKGTVHRIHYMMLALLVVKCLSLLFESVRYHYIAQNGSSELWSVVYFFFAFLKGIMLFTVILLIGSGWSLMKSYLNDKEKKIIYGVLVLQVLDNIAMIVLEESAPGSQGWLTWRDLLHLVDIICCCAILLPIVWSIRHLRMAAEVDGKAHNSLVKLQLFREFYVMVVAYIYFTRIVVYLLSATIPFYLLWLGPLSTELATLIFYVVTGFKFRPAVDNPYLPVRSEDVEGQEYGLDDTEDGLQMTNQARAIGAASLHA